jgi:hypothetical protein
LSRTSLLRLAIYLSTRALAQKKVSISSLRRYKGSEVAEIWSRAISRPVSMRGNDNDCLLTLEDRVEAHIDWRYPSGRGRDVGLIYKAFGSVGLVDSRRVRLADQIAREGTGRPREVDTRD